MKIGNTISKYLSNQNITQVQLSKMTGIPTSTLNDILRNKTKLSTKNKHLIFNVLNINELDFYNAIKFEMIDQLFENHTLMDININSSKLTIHSNIDINLSVFNKYTYNEADIVIYTENDTYHIDLYKNCTHREIVGSINYINLI